MKIFNSITGVCISTKGCFSKNVLGRILDRMKRIETLSLLNLHTCYIFLAKPVIYNYVRNLNHCQKMQTVRVFNLLIRKSVQKDCIFGRVLLLLGKAEAANGHDNPREAYLLLQRRRYLNVCVCVCVLSLVII